ncbi:FAD:protein FMN transferase [Kangiella sp. HD9-110m-PIT-SAG07]|nr:FAD:protein FMN transferase [Kangiella sp. HD9-110m-PIT-SAG07]
MRLFLILTLTLLCFACSEDAQYNKITGNTMGTTYNVIVQTDNASPQDIYKDIEVELKDINQLMSTYIPDSEINRFNQLNNGSCFRFSAKTWEVLLAAKKVYDETGGAFDITLGPLISRWGFSAEEYQEKVPSQDEIDTLLQQVGTDKITYDIHNQCLSKNHPNVTINLSAIAKGYGVDRVAEVVEHHGIQNYLVEIGGETRAKGVNPSGSVWRVAVEKPVSITQQKMLVIGLKSTSIATSGDYRNYFEVNGQRFSHTIDPATGFPVTHELTSVSVIHPENMYADAYATALTVMGTEKAFSFAQQYDLPVFLISHDGSELSTQQTVQFEAFTLDN